MPFQKNDPNIKKGGRVGPNVSTKRMKEAFAMLVEDNLDNMTLWLADIAADDPAKAMDLVIKLSERFVPALARTELTAKDGDDIFKSLQFGFGPPINSTERLLEDSDYNDETDEE